MSMSSSISSSMSSSSSSSSSSSMSSSSSSQCECPSALASTCGANEHHAEAHVERLIELDHLRHESGFRLQTTLGELGRDRVL